MLWKHQAGHGRQDMDRKVVSFIEDPHMREL